MAYSEAIQWLKDHDYKKDDGTFYEVKSYSTLSLYESIFSYNFFLEFYKATHPTHKPYDIFLQFKKRRNDLTHIFGWQFDLWLLIH